MVLIHGSLVTSDDMVLALMAQLSDQYDVIAFDRLGHGGSAQTPTKQGSPYAQAKMMIEGWRIQDAILDVSHRGDIVLDAFAGSRSVVGKKTISCERHWNGAPQAPRGLAGCGTAAAAAERVPHVITSDADAIEVAHRLAARLAR